MEITVLRDLLIVAALAVAVMTVSHHLRIPGVVGLLLAGIAIGSDGLGLMQTTHEVEVMAEVGVVLLLFTIGIEFSLTKLFRIRRLVLLGGTLQVVGCIAAAWGVGIALGFASTTALFVGFMIAMSSTAIVLQTLQERAEIEAPHGRAALGLLIFQDIAIVPLMLVAPLLVGSSDAIVGSVAELVGKLAVVAVLVFVGSRFIVPFILTQIARARRRELFVLAAVAICLAVAWMTSSLGLSLGLGAFLAGLIISESEYSHQTLGAIMPFRDVFTSLFFVSIGMLLDLDFLVERPVDVLVALVGVTALKTVVVVLVMKVVGYPRRHALLTALALAQIGEFSFLLAGAGRGLGLLDESLYQTFLAASVLSMALAPFMIRVAPALAARLFPRVPADAQFDEGGDESHLDGHLVIIGFGFAGQTIARAARRAGIPYLALDSNADNVRTERAAGEPVAFGDATYAAVLEHLRIASASIVALVINDPIATRLIVRNVRDINPGATIIVRTRFVTETDHLLKLGASIVIPEEFEMALQVCAHVLSTAGAAEPLIASTVGELRNDHYATLRQMRALTEIDDDGFAEPAEASIFSVELTPESPLVGRSLAELDLRNRHGLSLLQIRRGGSAIVNPSGAIRLESGDALMLFGPRQGRHALLRDGAVKTTRRTHA
jgi:CPA2 family monovalent cation:H+ antiporter-2